MHLYVSHFSTFSRSHLTLKNCCQLIGTARAQRAGNSKWEGDFCWSTHRPPIVHQQLPWCLKNNCESVHYLYSLVEGTTHFNNRENVASIVSIGGVSPSFKSSALPLFFLSYPFFDYLPFESHQRESQHIMIGWSLARTEGDWAALFVFLHSSHSIWRNIISKPRKLVASTEIGINCADKWAEYCNNKLVAR